MTTQDTLRLPGYLTRDFLIENVGLEWGAELRLEVPTGFSIEALAEGPALWWVEHLRRCDCRVHLSLPALPDTPIKTDESCSFLTTSFGYALLYVATSIEANRRPVSKDAVFALLSEQWDAHKDRIDSNTTSVLICRMPHRPLPLKLRLGRKLVYRNAVLSYFTDVLFDHSYPKQRKLGLDSVAEFIFQALRNALEENLFLEETGRPCKGTYGVHLARIDAGARGCRVPQALSRTMPGRNWGAQYWMLNVTDLGRGIPKSFTERELQGGKSEPELIEHAFVPEVTTKRSSMDEQQPGFGLPNIEHACRFLEAILVVECGQTSLVVDFAVPGAEVKSDQPALPSTWPLDFGTSISVLWWS